MGAAVPAHGRLSRLLGEHDLELRAHAEEISGRSGDDLPELPLDPGSGKIVGGGDDDPVGLEEGDGEVPEPGVELVRRDPGRDLPEQVISRWTETSEAVWGQRNHPDTTNA